MPDPSPPNTPSPTGRRAALGWIVVGVAAAAVLGSFALAPQEDAAAEKRAGPRVAPVSAAAVERASVTERGRYPGELDADAADVSAFYAGRLTAVNVRVGDTVAKGDVLAELDPVDALEEIARARAQADAAAAEEKRVAVELKAADAELARLEPLEGEVITSTEIDAVRARADSLRAAAVTAAARGAEARAGVQLLSKRVVESKVRAPFSGRIAARHVDPGAIVAAGTPLVRLVATSPLRVRFDVPAQELDGVEPGTKVRVVTQGRSGESAPAIVAGVAGEVSRDRRVATVEAVVEGPPAGWLPGMFAEAIVERRTVADANVVPGAAVLSRMTPAGALADGVFRVDGEVARWTPVRVEARDGDRVAITGEGVVPGAQVLVAGHVDLGDGAAIRVTGGGAPSSSGGPASSAPSASATPAGER